MTTALTAPEKPKSDLQKRQEAKVAEMRARNALVAAIRGQMWGKDLNEATIRAVAHYCNENGLDAVRHVEVLGGRIYLTADFYRERGAPLIRAGVIRPAPTDYINKDERLEALEKDADPERAAWARAENFRRLQLRIEHNAPEAAKAIAVCRLVIGATGQPVTGVNWCGGGSRQRDPVGDMEPTKTSESRAERRAWRKVADVLPAYGQVVDAVETAAAMASEEIETTLVASTTPTKQLTAAPVETTVIHPAPKELAKPIPVSAEPRTCPDCEHVNGHTFDCPHYADGDET